MTTSTDATTDATPASAPAPASPPPPASPAAAYPGADPGSSYVPAVLAPPADRRTDEDYGRDEGIGRNVYLAAFLAVAAGMLFAAAWWWNIAWPVFVAGVILWDCAKAGIRVALLVFHPDYRTPDEARRDRIDDALIVAKHLAESMRGVRSLIAVRVADDGRSLILLFDEAAEDKDLAACARNIPAVGRPTPVSWVPGVRTTAA